MLSRPSWIIAIAALASNAGFAPAQDTPLRNKIDAELRAVWQREKITPAGKTDDAAFLRRIYLDLAGTIPTFDDAKKFLDDQDAKKREKLIEKLLADPRFAVQQAQIWDQVLFGRNPPNGDATRKRDGFRKWLEEQFAGNVPYDAWVRKLLLAEEGDTGLFYVQYRSQIEETTVAVSRIFMGTQLQCARCHDHPYESITQKEFYGMAGFFARLTFVDGGGGQNRRYLVGEKSTGDVLFSGSAKEQQPGRKGDPIKPKFLGGAPLVEPELPKDFKEPDTKGAKTLSKPLFSRKEKFVAWLTAPDNPYFAKAVANRVWAQFMGRGQVHPVDDLSDKNKPTHPQLFQEMTKGVQDHRYDMKWLIREIVNSDAYQLACTGKDTEPLPQYYERGRVRPLTAEEMLETLREASGTNAVNRLAGDKKQGYGGDTLEYFARYFGEPTNGRGDFQASLQEHLFLNNSSNVRQLFSQRKGSLSEELMKSKDAWPQKVDRMFLTVLTRLPRPEERDHFVKFLASEPRPDQLLQDALWALVNTAEFRFNH